MVSVWQKEWQKFTTSSIENMKTYSDKTHEEREWMSYVYDVNGKYDADGRYKSRADISFFLLSSWNLGMG